MGMLLDVALEYEKAMNLSHEILLQCNIKKKKASEKKPEKLKIIINTYPEEFVHVTGLEHLSSFQVNKKRALVEKKAIFNEIRKGKRDVQNLTALDQQQLSEPIIGTFNTFGEKYTLTDRIYEGLKINNYINSAYKGKLYKWDVNNAQHIKLPDNTYRKCNIVADYVLVLSTGKESQDGKLKENFFIFLAQDSKILRGRDPIILHPISAFPDCADLTAQQGKPYYIVEQIVFDKKQKTKTIIYQDQAGDSSKTIDIKTFQYNGIISPSPSGTAALQAPAIHLTSDPIPPIFSNLKKELISAIRRINLSVNTYFSQLSRKMSQPKPAKHKKTTKVKNTNNSPRKSGQTAKSSAPKKKQSAPTKNTAPKAKTVVPQQQSTQPESEPPKRYYITNEHRRRNVKLINDKEKQSSRPITKKRNQNHSHDD